MKHNFLFGLMLTIIAPLQAIDFYQPGDSLYVWAQSGLVLRKEASLKAVKMRTVPYGATLVMLSEKSGYDMDPVEVEAVPGHTANGVQSPPVVLKGVYARVVFRGDTGWLFDGYLSRLPAMQFTINKNTGKPEFESFDKYATRNFGLLLDEKHGLFEYAGPESTTKKIFKNGFMTDIRSSKGVISRMILPDLSKEEAFLIFNYTEGYEYDVRHPSGEEEDVWIFIKNGPGEWSFGHFVCGFKILFLEHERTVIITSECSC